MDTEILISSAEKKAEYAENLKAFSGLKLLHIRKQLVLVLAQIGKGGIFDEYTKHDISHIDSMLASLDWIIPEETKQKMSHTDWLMITLAIYFHDLGMLVTKEEFNNRESSSSFNSFKKEINDGQHGIDFKDKINSIVDSDAREKFLYQEYVRKNHAERIKLWILDEKNSSDIKTDPVANEIKSLLSNIDEMFRRDLAIICESHHLSDLDDFEKYKTNQQYGTSTQEIANLHYAAILLRTSDLLHITSDRTPSIEFNLINPTDPKSQEEWAKQKAVRTIRPQAKKNIDGEIDPLIPKDTLEVIALFKDENGFFGLISYLNYARSQLCENFKYNEMSKKMFSSQFDFPWKNIDDSLIETKDFEKKQFEFVLDQTRILDLLVGHTLYNDPTVVLRELSQNAIDATKLKLYEYEKDKKDKNYKPEITINWLESGRELSFIDNGTGMTLDVIKNHLLKVGSSRYQDEAFKKKYPDFSSISRFGIGLLTCFLVADDLDIITKSSESDKAILLKIKKVHGKYLLKYLPIDKIPNEIQMHGTVIKLFVRSGVKLNDIETELRKWIIVPNANLTLKTNQVSTNIGFKSSVEALKYSLEKSGFTVDDVQVKIIELNHNGVNLVFALKYIDHLKEWDFLKFHGKDSISFPGIGICIEGIKVDFNTPGFVGKSIYAIANSTGKNSPKTNVARSNIEKTPERECLLSTIYSLFLKQISNEILSLRSKEFSITWAANEAMWLLNSFYAPFKNHGTPDSYIEDQNQFELALSTIKCVLIEKDKIRNLVSINDLVEGKSFWTIDCASYKSADSLIREVESSNSTALTLLDAIMGPENSKTSHINNLLCNKVTHGFIGKIISDKFQVTKIIVVPKQRRIDMLWAIQPERLWNVIEFDYEDRFNFDNNSKCYLQVKDIEFEGLSGEIALKSNNNFYFLKESRMCQYLTNLYTQFNSNSREDQIILSSVFSIVTGYFNSYTFNSAKIEEYIDNRVEINNHRNIGKLVWKNVDKQELIQVVLQTKVHIYDTSMWYRRELI